MKRTGSRCSRVGPAVISTRLPSRLRQRPSSSSTAATMASGSSMRPLPSVPQAKCPLEGNTTRTPRASSAAMFSWVTGEAHMPSFIAGATISGAGVASAVVVSRSSAVPLAILAQTLAVAGAMQKRSASRASEMWWMGSPGSSKSLTATSSLVSARKVVGPTKCVACSVMTTFTRTPAFCRPRTM